MGREAREREVIGEGGGRERDMEGGRRERERWREAREREGWVEEGGRGRGGWREARERGVGGGRREGEKIASEQSKMLSFIPSCKSSSFCCGRTRTSSLICFTAKLHSVNNTTESVTRLFSNLPHVLRT